MFYIDARPAKRSGLFIATIAGRDLCTSRQPFLDAARILLREGASPETVMVMRWSATGTESLTATVGAAAKLTVWEPDRGRPHFAEWKPRHSSAGTLPMRSIGGRVPDSPLTGPSSWAA